MTFCSAPLVANDPEAKIGKIPGNFGQPGLVPAVDGNEHRARIRQSLARGKLGFCGKLPGKILAMPITSPVECISGPEDDVNARETPEGHYRFP